jgi:carboxylesterase type B
MDTILVKLNQGIVKGCRESLPSGRKFQRFTGIPYAKPPIGELRFKAPKKLEKFEFDEIDCTKEGNASFHRSSFSREILGSEDCLILNVFVPENTSSKKLPVMFFIHGGELR